MANNRDLTRLSREYDRLTVDIEQLEILSLALQMDESILADNKIEGEFRIKNITTGYTFYINIGLLGNLVRTKLSGYIDTEVARLKTRKDDIKEDIENYMDK